MTYSEDTVKIITLGRCFWHDSNRPDIWAAEVLWVDDDESRPIMERLKGKMQGVNHVRLEVIAALEGLKRGVEIGKPIEVHAVNQAVVDTIPQFIDRWIANGWRKSDRKPPKNLEEWQEIHSICQDHSVSWAKRKTTDIDHLEDWESLWTMLGDENLESLMQRALERDPY